MNLFAASPTWIIWLLAGLLAAAAIQDTVSLRISNLITGLVLALAVVAAALAGLRIELWQNLAAFLVVLAIGTALFSRSVLGGGDVKLLAAVSLWVDGGTAVRLVAAIAIAGGILALVIIVLRIAASDRVARRVKTLQPGAGIPYGIAIGLGTLLVIGMTQASGRAGTYNSDLQSARL